MQFTDEEKLKEVEKEIAFRWSVFPKQVKAKRMSQAEMDRRIGIMQSIRDELRARVQGRLL